jgi:hypothetical protein
MGPHICFGYLTEEAHHRVAMAGSPIHYAAESPIGVGTRAQDPVVVDDGSSVEEGGRASQRCKNRLWRRLPEPSSGEWVVLMTSHTSIWQAVFDPYRKVSLKISKNVLLSKGTKVSWQHNPCVQFYGTPHYTCQYPSSHGGILSVAKALKIRMQWYSLAIILDTSVM